MALFFSFFFSGEVEVVTELDSVQISSGTPGMIVVDVVDCCSLGNWISRILNQPD